MGGRRERASVFPVGGDFTQTRDDGRKFFEHEIHFFPGVVAGEAESDGAVGGGVGNAHCAQNVRGFQTAGRAGAAA